MSRSKLGLLLGLLAAGCGSSSTANKGPVAPDHTVGLACATNAQCDVTGTGRNACSSTALDTFPTGVCVGLTCTLGAAGPLAACDGGAGVCVLTGSVPRCVPGCTFGNGGSAAGCIGKNRCNVDTTTTASGAGDCVPGCESDADCPGRHCQVETGECTPVVRVLTKQIGAACTPADQAASACACWLGPTSGSGYCTSLCTTGAGNCPTGFTCDAELPTSFSSLASGLSGICTKNCASSPDCSGLGSQCVQDGGGIPMTCVPY